MDRKSLAKFTHKADNFLSIENSNFKQWVFRYTFLELEKDLSSGGDLSTRLLFSDGDFNVRARIVSKTDGIIAGLRELKYFLVDADVNFRPRLKGRFVLDFKFNDGDKVSKGDTVLEISANVHDLFACERVVLNFLMRMSAVATKTFQIVEKIRQYNVLVTPTRKTLWGLLDKKAVLLGGGGTHRLNLSDSIMIKDTHLDVLDRNFDDVFKRIEVCECDCRFLEIEVSTPLEAIEVARRFSALIRSKTLHSIGVVLMDNMPFQEVETVMDEIKRLKLYDNILFEASGGINEETVVNFAQTGVDIISMGVLTDGTERFDVSMKVVK